MSKARRRLRHEFRKEHAELFRRIHAGAPLGSPEREDILVKTLEALDANHDNTAFLGFIQALLSKMKPTGSDLQTVVEAVAKARKKNDT